jgi:ActR/RegA family two-component response regulator
MEVRKGFAEVSAAPPTCHQVAQNLPARTSGDGRRALTGGKLLIVEDEYLIAQDLAYGSQREGIDVLGPYSSIASAIDVVKTTSDISAAIVDLNIRGHIAFDLAEKLAERKIPFIFYTGYESLIVPEQFRNIDRVRKPAEWSEIKQALFGDKGAQRASRRLVKQLTDAPADLRSLLPILSNRAREITASSDMAEHLVEITLERAIREIGACPAGVLMEHWLLGLLETTGIGDRRHLN